MEHPLEGAALGHKRGSHDALCTIFSPDAVLLGRERQCDKVGRLEVACHGCGHKDAADATVGSIFDMEWGSL